MGAVAWSDPGLISAPRISVALANEAVGAAVRQLRRRRATRRRWCWWTLMAWSRPSLRGAMAPAFIPSIVPTIRRIPRSPSLADTMAMLIGRRPWNTLVTRLPHLLLAGGGVVIKSGLDRRWRDRSGRRPEVFN